MTGFTAHRRLQTARLDLRPFHGDDLDAFAAIMADDRVSNWIAPDDPPPDRATVWRTMAMFLGHWELRGHGQYALAERDGGALVGRVGFWRPEGWPVEEVEVGWLVAYDRQGRGYATEAAGEVIRHARADLGVDRLVSLIRPDNAPSRRVAEKLGMREERAVTHAGRPHLVYVTV